MKASELLKKYAAGKRNFQRVNLRGQSFKGQDLSEADFSEADIRSANSTGATLIGAKFIGAKCGLQQKWVFFFLLVLSFLSSISGASSVLAGKILEDLFLDFYIEKYTHLPALVNCMVLIIFIIAIIKFGLTKNLILISGTVLTLLIVGDAVLWIFKGPEILTIGQETSWRVAGTVGWAIAGTITGVIAFAGAWLIYRVSISILIIAWIVGLKIAIIATNSMLENSPNITSRWSIAVSIASILGFLYTYIVHKILTEDERYTFIKEAIIAFTTFGGTSFREAKLSDADFSHITLKNVDFRETTLTHVRWFGAKRLDRVRPGDTYLKEAQVRQWLIEKKGDKNFDRKDLRGVNLQGAILTDASFIGADLSEANLQDTDLSRAKLVQTQLDGTDFTGATLTGAFIEDWNITSSTVLNGVRCEKVFMRLPTKDDPEPHRKPDDDNKIFEEGEFVDFITPLLQTLDLYHNRVDDPRLIATAFQQLQENHPEAEIQTVSVEVKGKNRDKLLLRAETTKEADRSELHAEYFTTYNDLQALSPQELHLLLVERTKNYQNQIRMLKEMVSAAISRPGIHANTYQAQGNTMSDKSSDIKIGDVTGGIGAFAGGDIDGVAGQNQTGVAGGNISGQVTVTINKLPPSPEPDKPGIKELLVQLQEAIEAEANLDDEDKAEALEQVQTLAEAGKNPKEGAMKKAAKRATTMLKGIISGLPDAAKLAEACNKLIPMITKIFGL